MTRSRFNWFLKPFAAQCSFSKAVESNASHDKLKCVEHSGDKLAPEVREKSGVWYRLNRWREEQIVKGNHPTYGDLVRHYIALNKLERFEKVPQVRYINFLAEFFAAEKGATRSDAIAAWTKIKTLDVPKTYASWVRVRGRRTRTPV